jgi:hypothetical protein
MRIQLSCSRQKFLFVFIVTAVYATLVVWLNFLQAPAMWDEHRFWKASLVFSDRLIPTFHDLKNYGELNTPLPFIIFGLLENLFHQGLFAGRLLNLGLAVTMAFIIGWPVPNKRDRAILCLLGLFLCPYYHWYSVLMYTDAIACFFGLMGVMGYVHNRHWLSCVWFVLAIASRQYMVAFPAAIFTYELIPVAALRDRRLLLSQQIRWIAPLLAVFSLLVWVYLFQGLAPEVAMQARSVPEVQKTLWVLTPGIAVNFLAFSGFYLVIPEFILFRAKFGSFKPSALLQPWRKIALIAAVLLGYVTVFPPALEGMGSLFKIAEILPQPFLASAFFYGLALLACIRFCNVSLMSLFLAFNCLIMMKAYPWDKYVLPLVIIFWYLKSAGLADQRLTLNDSSVDRAYIKEY